MVQRFKLEGNQKSGIEKPEDIYSAPCSASLPSFYQEVSTILKEELSFNSRQMSFQMDPNPPATNPIKDLALERNLDHIRKMLRNSLPPQDVAQRLVNLFFQFQNSVFYVCNEKLAQEQLDLMFEDSNLTSVAWFCQMFLIFAVGTQFDDLDDGAGESYYQISQRSLDDAIEEKPQNTLWVTRAMLLLCFYQPPTKWSSIWIHLDVAIRTAHKFQLDLGHNVSKKFSDEEYQEWRQIWLTIICFDRDPVFQDLQFASGLDTCVMQNHITSLGIISGHILRDIYFSELSNFSLCQQRKHELERWTATLPEMLRNMELHAALDLPKDQLEAAFNLHFMQLGTWMLLTRPSLFKVVKSSTSPMNFVGPAIGSNTSDAKICVDSAFRLINSATTILSELLPPKRSFMPLFFLVNAAHVMILGAVWNMKQNGEGYDSTGSYDQSRELLSIDAATRVLDLCGQRNAFARKYSVLIKDLRQNLNKNMLDVTSGMIATGSALTDSSSLNSPFHNHSLSGPEQTLADSIIPITEGQAYQNSGGTMTLSGDTPMAPLHEAIRPNYYSSTSSTNIVIEPWSEHFGIFYPTNDASSHDSSTLLNESESEFVGRPWQ